MLSLPSTLYAICSTVLQFTFYSLCSTGYSLHALRSLIYPPSPSTLYSTFHQLLSLISTLRSYHLPSKPIYALLSMFYQLLSLIYILPSKPICLEGYWNFVNFFFKFCKFCNFLMKTSEQHKGRLLVVVRFFIYFRHVSSV